MVNEMQAHWAGIGFPRKVAVKQRFGAGERKPCGYEGGVHARQRESKCKILEAILCLSCLRKISEANRAGGGCVRRWGR